MRRAKPESDSSGGPSDTAIAEDSLFGGAVRLRQPARGYRVNVDTLFLADFAARCRPSARRVVDLGAGVGALSLALAHLGASAAFDLVEREPGLATLAVQNLAAASVEGRVHVADLAVSGLPAPLRGVADVVVSNPPFFTEAASRASDASRRTARSGSVEPFLRGAESAMGRRAYTFFAYPAPSLPDLLRAAERANLVPKRLRLVHAFADVPARLVLVELRRAKPGGLVIDPPLFEWSAEGVRSREVAALLSGRRRPHRTGDPA